MNSLRHSLAAVLLAIVPLGLIVAQTAGTTTPAAKKKTYTKKRKGSSTSRTATSKTGSSKKGTTTATRQPYRPRQVQPAPERYKEIQQALASKGYLSGEPSGAWNQDSADAMRRFQQDQNINASGKIDSLSLIALGLGPKRGPTPAAPVHSEQKTENTPQFPSSN